MNIEEERRKVKMTREEYLAVQQPVNRKTGKVNELFIKAFGKDKLPKKNK